MLPISIGLVVVMPVVFAEMIGCDAFLKPLGGHFLYDLSVALFGVVYTIAAFRVQPSAPKAD
jgi:hypothetical protein